MKKILHISLWSVLIIGLLVTLGFVDKEQDALPCKSLNIVLHQNDENFFLEKEDIKQIINDKGNPVINQSLATLNIPELENILNSNAAIANAEVSVTVDGNVKVDATLRKPIIRVFNKNGESYYIDEAGTLMPWSEKFTARVLVANGNITEPYSRRYMYSISDIERNSDVKDKTMLDDLYNLSKYITADEFWKAQIEQIYINEEQELELIPRVGDHKIMLGDVSDMDEKFKKLKIFYTQGLNTTGNWNNYSIINLKFKNQIVCTKKQ